MNKPAEKFANKMMVSLEEEDESFGIKEFLPLVRRNFSTIFSIVFLLTLASAAITLLLPDIYTAETTIVLETNNARILNSDPNREHPELDRTAVETELSIIQSRSLAGEIAAKLDLVSDPFLNPYIQQEKQASSGGNIAFLADLWHGISSFVRRAGDPIEDTASSKSGGRGDQSLEFQFEQTVTAFLSHLSAERTGESVAVYVRFSHTDPGKAAQIANEVADAYIARRLKQKQLENEAAIVVLKKRAEALSTEIANAELEYATLNQAQQFDQKQDKIGDQLRALAQQNAIRLESAEKERTKIENEVRLLDKVLNGSGPADARALPDAPYLAALLALKTQEKDIEETLKTISARADASDSAQIAGVRNGLFEIRKKIAIESQRQTNALEQRKRANATEIEQRSEDVARIGKQIDERTGAFIRYSELDRLLQSGKERYNQIIEGISVYDLRSEVLTPSASIVSRADMPVVPSFPNRKAIVAGGFISATILAFMIVLLIEGANKKLRSSAQAKRITGVPNMAFIPGIKQGWFPSKLIPSEYISTQYHSAYTEAIRALYLACHGPDAEERLKTVMVTSGLPGEGKTSTAISLAKIASTHEGRIALVDLDFHQRGVSRILNLIDGEKSFDHYMDGSKSLKELAQSHPSLEKVDIFTSTRQVQNGGALASSPRIKEMFSALRENYDFIVVDTSPNLIVNDAGWSMPYVDGAIVVIKWAVTTEDALRDIMERMKAQSAPLLGTVFNRVNPEQLARSGYGGNLSYYRYAKGYYYRR